jgi:hypothetical protein
MFRTPLPAALIALACFAVPVLAVLLVLVTPAAAQSTVIDAGSIFGAWKPYIVEILASVIALLAGWVFNLLRVRFGLDIDARHRETLETTLTNAVGVVLNQLEAYGGSAKLDVKNAILAEAVTYVLKGAPDALRHFGLTEDRIREKIVAKAGALVPAT